MFRIHFDATHRSVSQESPRINGFARALSLALAIHGCAPSDGESAGTGGAPSCADCPVGVGGGWGSGGASGGVTSSGGGSAGASTGGGSAGAGGWASASGGTNPGAGGTIDAAGGETNSGGAQGSSGGSKGGTGGADSCVPDPSCKPTPPDSGDFHADCVARVNQFRSCMCLMPLNRNTAGEACAGEQAQYDAENDTFHGGIRARICQPDALNEAAQNECPEYPSVSSTIGLCHQQMFDEGSCDDFDVCGHFLNITNPRAKSVACGYHETASGTVWMVENFYF